MPRESYSWGVARHHLSPYGQLLRVENRLSLGTPDVIYCLLRVSGWIETKSTPQTLTLDQVIFAEVWGQMMPVHTLLHTDKAWSLYDPAGTRALYEKRPAVPVVTAKGKFPTVEIVKCLTRRF